MTKRIVFSKINTDEWWLRLSILIAVYGTNFIRRRRLWRIQMNKAILRIETSVFRQVHGVALILQDLLLGLLHITNFSLNASHRLLHLREFLL